MTTLPAPMIVLTVDVSGPDMDALVDAIAALAAGLNDPDQIATIRVDEVACRAELDIAARPVDPRRLN